MSVENEGATTTAYTAAKSGTSEHTTHAVQIMSIFSDDGVSYGENLIEAATCSAGASVPSFPDEMLRGCANSVVGRSCGVFDTLLAYPIMPAHATVTFLKAATPLGVGSTCVSTTGPCSPKMLRACRLSSTLFFRRVVAKSTLSKMALIASQIRNYFSRLHDVMSL